VGKAPSTPAVRLLRERKLPYTEHLYRYQERGGTAVSARELGVDEHAVVKTLVMEDEAGAPLIILQHGDREVSVKALARQLGRKAIAPCRPEVAQRHSGYQVGGTSPLGTRKPLPVFVERTVLDLPIIYVNGGSRGFLVGVDPKGLAALLGATPVDAAIEG
jgi:Cys-tRNA(Pro) deacylase